MMRRVLLLAAAISVTACTVAPYKQPMDTARAHKLREAAVYAKADDRGFGVQYFAQDSSAAGAPYGLVGVLVAATMDSVANAGPIGIAANGAADLAPSYNHERTAAQFTESLQTRLGQGPLFDAVPTIQTLDKEQKWAANEFPTPTSLLTSVEYSLTQDLRSLEVALTATAVSKDAVKLRKRGNRKGQPDEGIVYRNRFEYRSAPLAVFPEKSDQQIDAEIEQIKAKYAQASQTRSNDRLRANQTTGERERAMKKEIARVRRQAPPDVTADYYVGLWLANDAVLLSNELQAGLTVVADLLASDLQDAAAVDKATKPATTILVSGDKRVVSRMNLPPFKGSLVSESVDYARPASNAVTYPRKKKAEAAAAPGAEQQESALPDEL